MAFSQSKCVHIFTKKEALKTTDIYFTQNFIGMAWALTKLEKLRKNYRKWQKSHETGSVDQYILERTGRRKTIPAIRDLQGNVRIVDNHHSFFSYIMLLLGQEEAHVVVSIEKDYSMVNGRTLEPWTPDDFMDDLRQNNWVNFMDSESPTWEDVQNLPIRVEDLRDNPSRSLLSMTLRALPIPLKGSDFISHGQNVILDFIGPRVEEFSAEGADPVSRSNIKTLRHLILEDRKVLEEIRAHLSPDLKPKRREKIDDFLDEAISALN